MRSLLRSLANGLWNTDRNAPARGVDPDVYLRPLIVLIIVLLSGPEVFAAADLVSLLDLLGAVLFLTAFAVGYRALACAVLTRMQGMLFPTQWAALVKTCRHPSFVTHGLVLIGANALQVTLICLIAVVGVLKILSEVV